MMRHPVKVAVQVSLVLIALMLFLKWTGVLPVPRNVHVSSKARGPETSSNPTAPAAVLEIPRPDPPNSPAPTPPASPTLPPGESPPSEIVGIGAALGMNAGELVIMNVLSGSPAERAGLVRGWILHKVDGISTRDQPLVESIKIVRGPLGSKAKLELIDPETNERHTYEITRDRIIVR